MASIDRVMALAEEIKKKKKDKNYQINQSAINISDLTTDIKSGNKDALKNYMEADRGMFDAPIKTTVKNKSNVKVPDKKWYQQVFTKGEFKDGYDFGDVTKTLLGTATDITEELGKSALSTIEGVVDIGTNIGATALDVLGKEDTAKKWRDFAGVNISSNMASKLANITPTGVAYNIINGTPEKIINPNDTDWDRNKSFKENVKNNINDVLLTESNEDYEDSSVMGYYADKTVNLVGYALSLIFGGQALTKATGTVAGGVTTKAGTTAIGGSLSGGNIGLTVAGKTLNVPTLAVTGGMASGLEEANSKEDVTEAERWAKALSSGAIEGATEGLFGMFGVGGITNQAGQEVFDVAGSKAASLFKSSIGKTLANAGIKATGEAAEEFIAYSLNYLTDNHIIDKMGKADFSNEWNWQELGETLALSFASSMIMQGGGGVIQTNSAITEAEKQLGRKLTSKEKALVTQASIEGTLEQKVNALQGNTQETQTQSNNLVEQTNQQPVNIEQEIKSETKEQEPLANSKVRDEKGDLITVYHGTRAEFDTYDTSKAGQNYEGNWSNNGKGIYFTDSKEEALEYAKSSIDEGDPKVKEAQLDITNPFDSSKDYTKELSAMAQEYGIDPYYLERGDRLFSWFNKNNKDIVEALKKYGYDGIVDHGHYTVFDSKQIKNIEKQTEPKRKTMTQKKMEKIEGSKKTNQDGYEYTIPNSLFRGQRTAPVKGDSVTLAKYGEAEYYTPRKTRAEAFGEVTEYNNMEEKFQNPYIQGTPYNSKMVELLEEFKKNNPDRASHIDKALKQGFPLTQEYMTPKEIKDLYLKAGYDSFIGGTDSAPEYLSFTNDNTKQDTQASESIAPLKQELGDLTNELKKAIKDTKKEIKSLKSEIKEVKTNINETVEGFKALTEADLPMIEKQSSEAFNTLTDEDYAPVIEDTIPEYEESTIESPLETEGRDIDSVGNRKVKAYQYENPEVRPYFQAEARVMLGDLHNSVKGERSFNDQVYYDTAGEQGFYGTTRQTTDDIAYLKDSFGYSYAEIEKGLNAIIEDHGAENIAVAKRIEFMLDERLREGYTSIDGTHIPANQEYINLLQGMEQAKQYSEAPLGEAPYVEEVAEDIPYTDNASNTEVAEEIAPIRKAFNEKVRESAKEVEKELGYLPKDPTRESSYDEVAEILTEEPKTQNDRNKRKAAIIAANVLDKGLVFENVSLKHKNRELMGKWDYTLTSEARAQTAIGQGHYDNETGKTISKSLNEIMEEVNNTGLTKQFYEYIYHKHNVDRMQLENKFEGMKNKPVFGEHVTAKDSQEIVSQYEFSNPEFIDFAKDVYDYVNADRKLLVDNGVISQETADLWSKMYPHYVPIRRAGHTGNAVNVPLDTGRTGINAPIKKATGGSSDILPLFDTMASRTLQTYRAAAKNSFGVELKNTIGTTINTQKTTVDEVIDSVDAQESLLQEGKAGQKPTFTVFEDGKKITFEITEDMYDALKPLSDSSLLSKTIKPLNIASSIHRGVLTQYNPVFAITNGIKDIQDVLLNSQHVARTYAKIPEAYAQVIKKGYWYQEYMANGGEHNSYFDSQDNTFKTENKGLSKLLDAPPLKQIAQLNDFIESVPRLAEYIASREMGRSIEVSMLDAARVTTNFKAGGNLTKFLNRNGATFLNASVQGAMQQVRNIREAKANGIRGWANLATKFAIAELPAFLLNALLWDDDDDYEELSDYVKQNYYIVAKTDDGKFIRIPKGRATAVIQDAIEQSKNFITGDDEVDLASFIDLMITNLAPSNPIESNIFAPIIQVANNETWYGEDLVPTRLQDLPAAEQYDESTDMFSRWLGEKTGWSPYKINYLLDQYSGGLGDVLLPPLTPEAESGDDSFLGNMIAPLKSKFTTDAVMNNQNVSDFYSKSEELTTNAKKSNATDEDVLKNKYINSVKAEMNELYAEKREIQNSDLPSSEKYNKVREIQSKIVDLSKKALNSYEDIDIYSDYASVGDRHYTVDSEGEWKKINDKQLEKQNAVTDMLGISPNEYWENKTEYDYAYENPSKYMAITQIDTYENYNYYKDEIADIKEQLSSDRGYSTEQRKAAVQEYIESLPLSIPQKLMLENMAGGYSIKSYKSYIQSYIESLPLTAKEKQAIDDELFK